MSKSMTTEEAIRILDPDCKEVWKAYDGKDMERCNEACRAAVKALEYRIPKKPNYEGDGYDEDGYLIYDTWICPNCGKYYEVDYDNYDFCPNCGQALDWSYEE